MDAEGCYPLSPSPAADSPRRALAASQPQSSQDAPKTPLHALGAVVAADDAGQGAAASGGRFCASGHGLAPPPGPGMGDMDTRRGGGSGTLIGGVTRTRGLDSSRLCVGDVVWNVSGRGVWGFGTIVAVIPADVKPRYWCRRRGLPLVFGRRCARVPWERYIVRGDDGSLHTPRHVLPVARGVLFELEEKRCLGTK